MSPNKKRTTIKVSDIIHAMNRWAPEGLAYDWDKVGLSTGTPEQPVSKVLTALTISVDTVKAAKRAKADMIVAHHPLIWAPVTNLRSDDPKNRLYLDIINAGIATYAAHTNLDVVDNGVNHILAERLDLTDTKPLFPVPHTDFLKLVTFVPETHFRAVHDATAEAGAGVIGNYTHCGFHMPGTGTFKPTEKADPYAGSANTLSYESELRYETPVSPSVLHDVIAALKQAHPYEEVAYDVIPLRNPDPRYGLGVIGSLKTSVTLDTFAKRVRQSLEISHVRVTGKGSSKVKRIAVMGGAGGDSAARIPEGIDVFVTGDLKYHNAIDARDAGLNVIDAGHHGTEKWIAPAIADHLKSQCSGLKTSVYMESDPFRVI